MIVEFRSRVPLADSLKSLEAPAIGCGGLMQQIDYGSVADWVSGVGTLLAVIVALWIAGSQQRAERRARELEAAEQKERTKEIIAEAIALAKRISENCQEILGERAQVEQPSGDADADRSALISVNAFEAWKLHDIAGLRGQVLALQSYGVRNVHAYIEISRMGYETDISYHRQIDHRHIPPYELKRVVHDMGLRVEKLRAILETV